MWNIAQAEFLLSPEPYLKLDFKPSLRAIIYGKDIQGSQN